MYDLVHAYTGQVTLIRYQKHTAMFNWSPCKRKFCFQVGGSIYASHEVDTFKGVAGGFISRWTIDNGQLERQEYVNLGKTYPAHILIDTDHNLSYTANYGSGSVNVIQMSSDGELKEVVQTLTYGEGCRDASHPHQIVRVGDLVWVVDLGCDAIYSYRVEGNQLKAVDKTQVEAAAGPRHMVVNQANKLIYLLCEQKNFLLILSYGDSGHLEILDKVVLAEEEGQYGAEILLSEDQKTLYASSRGVGIISVYNVQGNSLVKVQEVQLVGTWPRSFDIRGNVMLAADQKSHKLQVLSIDSFGMLTPGESIATPKGPGFVMFL